jgi:hypothetical protein
VRYIWVANDNGSVDEGTATFEFLNTSHSVEMEIALKPHQLASAIEDEIYDRLSTHDHSGR